jgi:ankyrin repeat protein
MRDAVHKSDWSRVLVAVIQGANPKDDGPPGFNENALHRAIADRRLDVAEALLRLGADPNSLASSSGAGGYRGNPLETVVAYHEHLDAIGAIDMLVKYGTHVDGRGGVLAFAAQLGLTEVVQRLLHHGADPNIQDDYTGNTALHSAVRHKHPDIIKLLIRSGADPNLANKDGVKPMDLTTNHSIAALLTAGATANRIIR